MEIQLDNEISLNIPFKEMFKDCDNDTIFTVIRCLYDIIAERKNSEDDEYDLKFYNFYLCKTSKSITKAVNKKHAKNIFGCELEEVISLNHIVNEYLKES